MKLNKSEKEVKKMVTNKERIASYSFGMGTSDEGKEWYFLPYSILRGTLMKSILFRKELKLEYYRLKKNKIEARDLFVKKNMNVLVKVPRWMNVHLIDENGEDKIIKSLGEGFDSDNSRVYELSFKSFLKTIIHTITPMDSDTGYYVFKDDELEKNLTSFRFSVKDFAEDFNEDELWQSTIDVIVMQSGYVTIYEGSMNDEKKPDKMIMVYFHD